MSNRNRKPNPEPRQTQDAFSNPLFGLGFGSQSPLEATEYPLTRLTDDYATLNSLYRSNWVVQNVVSLVVDDMLREWVEIEGFTPEQAKEFETITRKTRLRDRINQGLTWGRLYGGAAGLILIQGQEEDLDKPLDYNTILPGSFKGLYILDRWSGVTPDGRYIDDLSSPDFGLPEYYDINGTEGNLVAKVHHSRIVRFTGRDLPYLEALAEMQWGESESEALYREVVAHDNVSANMAALTFQANVKTQEVKNLDQLFSLGSIEAQKRFWSVMQAQSKLRTNFGVQLVNEGTKITSDHYSFSGLQEVYESMCMDLCGASHYPMTKLFGRSPGGLNATGESDLRNYYDYTDSLREAKLRPVIEKLLPVICMSAWGGIPEGIEITFPPLWTPTAKEIATIAREKAQAIKDIFQAGLIYADTALKELKELSGDTGLFGSITDEEIEAMRGKTFQDVTAMRDPLAGIPFGDEIDAEAGTGEIDQAIPPSGD